MEVLKGDLIPECSLNKSLGTHYYDSLYTIREKIIQIDSATGKTTTAQHVRNRAVQVAMELNRMHIKEDDIVVISSRPHMDEAPVVLGCLMACVQLAPLDIEMGVDEIKRILVTLKPKVIFCDMNSHMFFKKIQRGLKTQYLFFVFRHDSESHPFLNILNQKNDTNFEPVPVKDIKAKNALIICTEGITDFRKLIKISHYTLYLRTQQYNLLLPPNCKRAISFFSMIGNMDLLLICNTFETGICRVIRWEFLDKEVDRLINVLRIEIAFLGTANARQFADYYETHNYNNKNLLKKIIIGGIPTLDTEIKMLEKKFNAEVLNIYYTIECGLISGLLGEDDEFDNLAPKGGKLFPGVKVKIVDPNTQKSLPVNVRGELLFSGPALTTGFFNNRSEASLTLNLEQFIHHKYYKTGDMASCNQRQQIFLHGSKDDVIQCHGIKSYFSDIEEVLNSHSKITECICFYYGDILSAIAVTDDVQLSAEDIYIYLQDKIAQYLMPTRVYIFSDIPKTSTGKVKKCVLESLLRLGPTD